MYDSQTGIEVFIRPFGGQEKYPEYQAPPESPFYTDKLNERYIEAVTDEGFETVTVIHPEFDF